MSNKTHNVKNALYLFASRLPSSAEIDEGGSYTLHMTAQKDNSILELKAELSVSEAELMAELQRHIKDFGLH